MTEKLDLNKLAAEGYRTSVSLPVGGRTVSLICEPDDEVPGARGERYVLVKEPNGSRSRFSDVNPVFLDLIEDLANARIENEALKKAMLHVRMAHEDTKSFDARSASVDVFSAYSRIPEEHEELEGVSDDVS